ncbi:uncharacterized protein LOC124889645 [Capsicum annuum]|uniref:uncharacterized protein LOC124889645 n=1 Tax=Capsicum annuum TaxID=4072 RepID=UPI001FB157A5|nr:uncharacterized protein LOC124889645 [Capsicum annuum]
METPYYPQMSGQVEVSNREIKSILAKIMNANRTDWLRMLDDELWAYQTTYKTPIGASSCQLVYGKICHLLVEINQKALWALKRLNFGWRDALSKVNGLDKFKLCAYESSSIYKQRMKMYHEKKIDKVNGLDEFKLCAYESSAIYKQRMKVNGHVFD